MTLAQKFKREYSSFKHARQRCNVSTDFNYEWYGARGIMFRFESFDHFLEVLGPRPQGKTLDRINVEGHYEPGNVRWATHQQQMRNRRHPSLWKQKEKSG